MADEIGLKAWEFGENLKDGYQKVDVRKNDKEPLKLAEEYAEKSTRLNPEDAKLILDHVKQVKLTGPAEQGGGRRGGSPPPPPNISRILPIFP